MGPDAAAAASWKSVCRMGMLRFVVLARGPCACAAATPRASAEPEVPMPSPPKIQGPASYFPSIEKQYGQPIDHWLQILRAAGEHKHMELVQMLKTTHGLGHGHANALVAWHMARR
jgi:hypothetical protein